MVVGGALLIACGLGLAWPTLRVIRAPGERWVQGRSQWLLFVWARRGEAPPSASELRLWASVWLGVAAVLLGLGIALIASAQPPSVVSSSGRGRGATLLFPLVRLLIGLASAF